MCTGGIGKFSDIVERVGWFVRFARGGLVASVLLPFGVSDILKNKCTEGSYIVG